MTTILNLFSNLDDLNKKKNINSTIYNQEQKYDLYTPTPGLNQGNNFNKYQKQINNNLANKIENVNSKEGFENTLTNETTDVLKTTQINPQQQNLITNLNQQYSNTLSQYQTLSGQVSQNTTNYIDRISSNNPFLNKNVSFSDGTIAYVTNKGIAKQYPDQATLNSISGQNGCPSKSNIVNANIPWPKEGGTILTTPNLIAGSQMVSGQSCGNEGNSVYVNQLISNSKTKYIGCYQDSQTTPTMTFIGDSPPPPTNLQNGNFSQPQIANNSYQYLSWNNTFVPGWNFNCALVNNSTAWGFPIPYPVGNQCACIQTTGELWTAWMYFSAGTYTLSFSSCARNCCDNSGLGNPINIGIDGETFYTLNPTITWNTYTTNFTVGTSGGHRLSFIGTWTTSDRSTAIQNIQLSNSNNSGSGSYTYNSCKQSAINNGYKYFALQDVNTSTSTGYCAVSNDSIAPISNGISYAITSAVPLWSSKTSGTSTNTATLDESGALTVLNSGGTAIFNTPNAPKGPTNYVGCYKDKSSRAMTQIISGTYDLSGCQSVAQQQGASYFGLQNSTSGKNAQCFLSSNLSQTQQYGKTSNCKKISDGSYSGGGYANAVYNTVNPAENFYLIIQDDGNMVIYKGSSPSDNQGSIWSTKTNGKQQKPNPLYIATNGKYGQNWISSGDVLAVGDFIGSNDGSMYLIMESDGNLVLYTSTNNINCLKMQDGNTGGGQGANALYEINQVGIPNNMQQLGYIDENSNLNVYPDSNIQLSQEYTKTLNTNCNGNDDLSVPAYTNATVDQCKTSCNSNVTCSGFVFDNNNNICYPKTSGVNLTSNWSALNNVDIYSRNSSPITPSTGITDIINNISSIQYQNYITGNPNSNSYGFQSASSNAQKQQLNQVQTNLNQLSGQIATSTGTFSQGNTLLNNQSAADNTGLNTYLSDLKNINIKLDKPKTNMNNILDDSDIVVLQENYNYLFWSILAVGTVLVSMNIVKK